MFYPWKGRVVVDLVDEGVVSKEDVLMLMVGVCCIYVRIMSVVCKYE